MPKQVGLPETRYAMKKQVTRRDQFLAEMDAVVPWTRGKAGIEPHHPQFGRLPMPLEYILRFTTCRTGTP